METRQLETIQKAHKLNNVYAQGEIGACGERSEYAVVRPCADDKTVGEMIAVVQFQHGSRDQPGSISGVLDVDLLEMIRDRLTAFQDSSLACPENMMALQHIEAALLYLNKRTADRAARGALGTMKP